MSKTANKTTTKRQYDINIFMNLYIGDFLRETMSFSTHQTGAYILLLIAYWCNEGPLKDNPQELAQICKLPVNDFNVHRPAFSKIFLIEDGFWKHKRIDADLTDAMERKNKAHYRAKAAAQARWEENQEEIDKGGQP